MEAIREKIDYKETDILFQAMEWVDTDIVSDDAMDVDEDTALLKEYVIKIYGVTQQGYSICCNVKHFTPFFYVKVPNNFTKTHVSRFINNLLDTTGFYRGKPYRPLYKFKDNILVGKCILQNKKDFYGFKNQQLFRFLRLTFNNREAMKKTMYLIGQHNDHASKTVIKGAPKELKLYESNVEPILRFIHIKNLEPSGWIRAENVTLKRGLSKTSTSQLEFDVDWTDISKETVVKNAPILQASFDIETYSHDGAFPSPMHPENCIFQIATTYKRFGDDNFLYKNILCIEPVRAMENGSGIDMKLFATEKELLLYWVSMISKTDPDILYTYNGDQFDCNYLYQRAIILGIESVFLDKLSRDKTIPCAMKEANFSSSAYGDTTYQRLTIPGRVNFDLLIYIKREYKENSYKLDAIAEKYLGENKNPVTAAMMFEAFRERDPEKLHDVAKYCVQDTLLPQKLCDKLFVLQNQISMSNVTYVPLKFLIEKGQQIKVFSQILKETRDEGYIVPTINGWSENKPAEDSFVGATVLPPLSGAYFDPITVCDFASLYPSIIRAHNLCHSTIVFDEEQYGNIEGVEYETIEWEDTIKDQVVHQRFKYAKSVPGILPKLLEKLTLSRKAYKKKMATATDPFEKEIYNKCQLAVKVSMNSVYGFLAAHKLPCKPIAATVTAVGRRMIQSTKDFMEKNYNASVAVYGDSVTGSTPLLLRDPVTDLIHIETIETICNQGEPISYPGFKAGEPGRYNKTYSTTHYEAWTDKGWSPIKKVIKHRTHKKIYQVLTHTGVVEVTEDHSLLDENAVIIKPTECTTETVLLHSYPDEAFYHYQSTLSPDKGILYGIFYAIGHCNGTQWSLDYLHHEEHTHTIKKIVKKEYNLSLQPRSTGNGYTIPGLPHSVMKEYVDMFYDKQMNKIVPHVIINACKNTMKAFMRGYDMYTLNTPQNITWQSQAGLYYICKKIHQYTDFSIQGHVINTFPLYSSPNRIKSISACDYGEIDVYDLETEVGRFQAGVGDIIVKNTDSVFIKFKTETSDFYERERFRVQAQVVITDNDKAYLEKLKTKCIQESMELGEQAAKAATKELFTTPISLEYEKVYCPLLLLSKKRYIGRLYSDNPAKMTKLDNKGVVLTRRDNFELLKKLYQHVIHVYTSGEYPDPNKTVLDYLNSKLNEIRQCKIPMEDLVITKSLKSNYKSTNIPHVVLAKKIAERDPNNAPKSNDRIPYIFIDIPSSKKMAQYHKVEDPVYALENKLPLDAEYYINFCKNPLCEILELFMKNPGSIFDDIVEQHKKDNGTFKAKRIKKN